LCWPLERDGGPVFVMKRLLLSLCLVGAVFPGHTRLVLQTAQGPTASADQLVEARAVAPVSSPAKLTVPEPQQSRGEQTTVRSPAVANQDTESIAPPRGDNQPTPLPNADNSSESSVLPVPEVKNEDAIWVVVIRGATVHSGPSVSAPMLRFYSVGTELQLIDYQHGWFQVLDPATSQRGWIYEKYYLQAIRGPGQVITALQEPANPKQKVVNARKPTPHVRRARIGPRPAKKNQPLIASAPRYRYETVASILERALRP
jgi:SH3 domain-containing protein